MTTFDDDVTRPGLPLLPSHRSAEEKAIVTRLSPTVSRATHPSAVHASWWWMGFAVLLGATAVLNLWSLGASGWANDFYSAAAQAGSQSWKAFFFGSSDAANAITVDKPPAALWLMGLSVRLFGLSSWSILVPQALLGVASVAVLSLSIRRWFGAAAGILAGAILAVTPVAVLMFRFNNPDALLVFLLIVGAAAMMRAVEGARMVWVIVAGSAVGFAFLTKMLQALLVVPAFALVYLVAAPTSLRRRILHVLAGGAAILVSAGWWVAAVELWPSGSRPYIGGSQRNSVLELIFGYNGFGRLTGNETGSVGGGPGGGGGRWGETGWGRLFQASWSGQIAWLIPVALAAIVVGFVLAGRAARTDRLRAAIMLWGGWLVVTFLTLSFGQGIIHEYYSVALAPAIGALVAIVARELWQRRDVVIARLGLAAGLILTGVVARSILGNAGDWQPWLGPVVIALSLAGAVLLMAGDIGKGRARTVAVGISAAALLLAPTAYAVQTVSEPHTGSIPSAGPRAAMGGGGGRMAGPRGGGSPGRAPFAGVGGMTVPTAPGAGGASRGTGRGWGAPAPPSSSSSQGARPGSAGRTFGGRTGSTARQGGMGGLLQAGTPSTAVVQTLLRDADDYRWVAATVGSNSAAGFQLSTQKPVMAIGGFNGSDPAPTLEQFKELVSGGEIHWFIGGGGGMGGSQMGGSTSSREIAAWVTENYTAQEIGNATLYDLTTPISSGAG